MHDVAFSLAITPSLPVPCPQLRVEHNAFDDFAVGICYLYMWQSRVEIKGYYFNHIVVFEAPYH